MIIEKLHMLSIRLLNHEGSFQFLTEFWLMEHWFIEHVIDINLPIFSLYVFHSAISFTITTHDSLLGRVTPIFLYLIMNFQ